MTVIVASAIAAGFAAVLFAKLCDSALHFQRNIIQLTGSLQYAVMPVVFALCAWLTRRLAPAAAGSGIPQIIAAAEEHAPASGADERISLRTSGVKILLTALMLAAGAAVGREGPTVQVAAAIVFFAGSRLRGGPSRRAMLIAGGAAGVAAAFNTLVAGIVFAVEELSKGLDRKTNAIIILVVVVAGAASYALAGDYAYFGDFSGVTSVRAAWIAAPLIGGICGVAGGGFAACLAKVLGPEANPIRRFRLQRPILFAFGCGGAAALAAWLSHGQSFGAGYDSTKHLLVSGGLRALPMTLARWVATLAASACGAPGGLFAPSLAIGAGVGEVVHNLFPSLGGRELVVLGMAAYLAGVVQAPLTSAVILMEMTRDPALVGPLMLSTLAARAVSMRMMREPLYHVLAGSWRAPRRVPAARPPED